MVRRSVGCLVDLTQGPAPLDKKIMIDQQHLIMYLLTVRDAVMTEASWSIKRKLYGLELRRVFLKEGIGTSEYPAFPLFFYSIFS